MFNTKNQPFDNELIFFTKEGYNPHNKVKLKLIPLFNKIKYIVLDKIYCSRMDGIISSSKTYTKNDSVWKHVFKNQKQLDKFLSDNKVIIAEISLFALGYDVCDTVINEDY
jgi:hypothetical protein